MISWESGDIDVDGVRLHYYRVGDADRPPVVLAHGFSDDGPCWTPLAESLADDYHVVTVDARGHGRSDAPETGYGLADLAADLNAVIQQLQLRRPAILGHSMGGATAYVLAGTYPETPGALLIEDAGALNLGGGGDRTASDQERQARMRAWVTGLKRQTRDELIAGQRAATPHWDDAELGTWADSKHRLSVNVLNRNDATPVDWQTILPRITCPALLITADTERGAMVTPDGADALQQLIPQLQIQHISGAGHCIRRDQPAVYERVVRTFLARTMAA